MLPYPLSPPLRFSRVTRALLVPACAALAMSACEATKNRDEGPRGDATTMTPVIGNVAGTSAAAGASAPMPPKVMMPVVDPGTLDPDSDGLSTAFERANGTDPERADTDGDGVGDLAERVAGTRPNDAKDSPTLHGDFYFLSPFDEAPTPEREPLTFATALRSADLMIVVDTTSSMLNAIELLRQQLSDTIVPQASMVIPDLQIGVASFQDVSTAPYGMDGDHVFEVKQALTADTKAAQDGVNALELGAGGDVPEAAIPALHALATGKGLPPYLPDAAACPAGGIGYACFRPDAVPIVLLVSDAEFHNGPEQENPYKGLMTPLPDYSAAIGALQAIKAHVISIGVGPGLDLNNSEQPIGGLFMPPPAQVMKLTPRDQMQRLSKDTGAVDAMGKPLFFEVDESASGLDMRVVDAVRAVAEQVPIAVSAVVRDDPSDKADATTLVQRVEPNIKGGVADPTDPTRVCQGGHPTEDRDGDGIADAFVGVLPGVPLCFDVIARKNTSIQAADKPAVYKAFVDVVADGKTVLSTRAVFFLVPPSKPVLL